MMRHLRPPRQATTQAHTPFRLRRRNPKLPALPAEHFEMVTEVQWQNFRSASLVTNVDQVVKYKMIDPST